MLENGLKPGSSHSAIVLAAGASQRMGRPKSELPWLENERLLAWTLKQLWEAGWNAQAVLGPDNFETWSQSLPIGAALLNPEPTLGKWTSIATGIHALGPETEWILIISVDQPRLGSLFAQLHNATEDSEAEVILPDRDGRRGHPVIISSRHREQLAHLDRFPDGLRGLLDELRPLTTRISVENPGQLDWDMNVPEDYESALNWFRAIEIQ